MDLMLLSLCTKDPEFKFYFTYTDMNDNARAKNSHARLCMFIVEWVS